MGGDELVLAVGRRAHVAVEDLPGIAELRGVREAAVRQVGGERLVQPKVVPPAHGHEVSEPHVGELVEDDLRTDEPLCVGGRVAEEEAVVERHGADVLHGTGVELRHEELVVLLERERTSEEVRVVVQALAGDLRISSAERSSSRRMERRPRSPRATPACWPPIRSYGPAMSGKR